MRAPSLRPIRQQLLDTGLLQGGFDGRNHAGMGAQESFIGPDIGEAEIAEKGVHPGMAICCLCTKGTAK